VMSVSPVLFSTITTGTGTVLRTVNVLKKYSKDNKSLIIMRDTQILEPDLPHEIYRYQSAAVKKDKYQEKKNFYLFKSN